MSTIDELYHHGILGMKWGKRNGPPYPLDSGDHSASEKKAGWRKSLSSGGSRNTSKTTHTSTKKRNSTDLKKKQIQKKVEMRESGSDNRKDSFDKLVSGKYKANEDYKEMAQKREAEKEQVRKTMPSNMVVNGQFTKEAYNYMRCLDAVDDKYRKMESQINDRLKKEKVQVDKDIFFNKDIKPKMVEARNTYKKISDLYDKTMGPDSQAYKKAFNNYKNSHKGISDSDLEYGFDHYEWRQGKSAFDSANKSYQTKVSDLQASFNKQIEDIGKAAAGGSTNAGVASGRAEEIIKFRKEYFE